MVDEMKRELNGIKTRLVGVDVRLDGIDKRMDSLETIAKKTAVAVAVLTEKMDSRLRHLETSMVTKADFKDFKSALDKFSGDVLASRRERALQDKTFNHLKDRIDRHEARLYRLDKQD